MGMEIIMVGTEVVMVVITVAVLVMEEDMVNKLHVVKEEDRDTHLIKEHRLFWKEGGVNADKIIDRSSSNSSTFFVTRNSEGPTNRIADLSLIFFTDYGKNL